MGHDTGQPSGKDPNSLQTRERLLQIKVDMVLLDQLGIKEQILQRIEAEQHLYTYRFDPRRILFGIGQRSVRLSLPGGPPYIRVVEVTAYKYDIEEGTWGSTSGICANNRVWGLVITNDQQDQLLQRASNNPPVDYARDIDILTAAASRDELDTLLRREEKPSL